MLFNAVLQRQILHHIGSLTLYGLTEYIINLQFKT